MASFFLLTFASVPLAREDARLRSESAALPFDPTEELVYEGELSKSLLRGINIATLRFTVGSVDAPEKVGENQKPQPANLLFTAEVETKGLFPKLFSGLRFHQRVESTVEGSSFTVLRTVKLDEQGKRRRESEAVFDLARKRVTWTERNPNDPSAQPRVVTSEFSGPVQDLASFFYYVRMQQLVPGNSFEVAISDSGQVYRIPIRVLEKKIIKTIFGEVETVRVDPEIFGAGRLIQGRGQVSVWFTTDDRHLPVRAQIKHEMGTLTITLKRVLKSKQ